MDSDLLRPVKDVITKNKILLKFIEPSVDICRKKIAKYGSSKTTVSVNDVSAEFYTESFEEVRHFWPLLGEREEISDLLSELKPTDTFYDIGAHVGIYTCVVGQLVNQGQVIAFEPVSSNVTRLQENMQLNDISADVHPVALSDQAKQWEMRFGSDEPGTVGYLSKRTDGDSETITSVTGNSYVRGNDMPLPNVMKIDVEGAECKVLRGLKDQLTECRLIYSEVSDKLYRHGDSEDELVEILQEMGFTVEYFSNNGVTHGDLKATRDV